MERLRKAREEGWKNIIEGSPNKKEVNLIEVKFDFVL